MKESELYDVIIVGGSYAGLSAAMALGRSLKNVLVIDSGEPGNRQTPQSHNFITHDGYDPALISATAKLEVLKYPTIVWLNSRVTDVSGSDQRFKVKVTEGRLFSSKKILFTTGIKDQLPKIPGFEECWGISAIHCPYCHGYEYRHQTTGLLMNGNAAADLAQFIGNWTQQLILLTNGPATLTDDDREKLVKLGVPVIESPIKSLEHELGHLNALKLTDGSLIPLTALYSKLPFKQSCKEPEKLGCAISEHSYIVTDEFKKTTVKGIYAAGDNTTMMRSLANAVAAGNIAGAMLNRELIEES